MRLSRSDMAQTRSFVVTGATGFIGRALCRVLRRRWPDGPVVGIGRDPARLRDLERELGVRALRADLGDSTAYAEALRGATHVFHGAALARFGNGPEYRTDVLNTAGLLAALKAEPALRRLVYLSSIGAIDRHPAGPDSRPLDETSRPHPASDYGRAKLEAEALVRQSGTPAVIVRLGWVYGPGMRADSHVRVFIEAVRRRALYTRFWLPGRVPLLHVEDAADAVLHLAFAEAAEHETYVLADDESVPLGRLFDLIDRIVLGREPRRVRLPAWIARAVGRAAPWLPLTAQVILTDALRCSNRKLRETGFRLRIGLEEGLTTMRETA